MAELYKNVSEEKLARNKAVQSYLERITFEMARKAEMNLREDHTHDGHAAIETNHFNIDHYITLEDDRGQDAAISIEFGRAGYIDPDTGETWGAMDGLYILRRATGIPRRNKRVPRERRRRPSRDSKTGRFIGKGS